MEIDRLEHVGLDVKNLDEAIKLFSRLLGTTFIKLPPGRVQKTITEHANREFENIKLRMAMDRTGFLEITESTPPVAKEGLRNIHLKVKNLELAKAEMKQEGIRLIAEMKNSHFKEAIYNPDDLCGVRMCLVEYDTDNMVDSLLESY